MDRRTPGPRSSGEDATQIERRRLACIPEDLAISIAYTFGRSLRDRGSGQADFDRLMSEWVDRRFAGTPLLPCIRAGFTAGFSGAPLQPGPPSAKTDS